MNTLTKNENEAIDQRRAVTPRVDIFENNDELMLLADVPGVQKDALELRIEKNELHLEGSVAPDTNGFHDGFVYRRAFALPNGIDGEKVSAELKHGVLKLRLPKAATQRTRLVPITAA